MVTGAWAQAYQLGSKVTDLANLSAEKLYAIHSTNNEGYWCYNSTINQNYVGITGVKTDGSGVVGNAAANTAYHAAFQPGNVNNQWKITNEDGTYYLYNVGAGQYVTRTDRDYLFTTEKTALDAIHANANGSFAIHAGGGYSGGSTNFACIVTNNTPKPFATGQAPTTVLCLNSLKLKRFPNCKKLLMPSLPPSKKRMPLTMKLSGS